MVDEQNWYEIYEKWWYNAVKEKSGLTGNELFSLLMYKCTGRELIIPEIIKAWRSIEEFIKAEKALEVEWNFLNELVGEFILSKQYISEQKNSTNAKIKKRILEEFSISERERIGKKYFEENNFIK